MSEDDADGLDYKVTAHETIQVEQSSKTETNGTTALSSLTENSTTSTPLAPLAATQPINETAAHRIVQRSLLEAIFIPDVVIFIISLALLMRQRILSETPTQ